MKFNIWQQRPYHLPIMKYTVQATVDGLSRIFPENRITQGGNYCEHGTGNYFYNYDELSKTVDALAKKAVESPAFFYEFAETALRKSVALREFAEKFTAQDLTKTPSEELIGFFKEFCAQWIELYAYGTTQGLLGYKDDNALYERMQSILKEKTKDQPEKLADYLVALTNPPKKLRTLTKEMEILKLAKKAKAQRLKSKEEILHAFKSEFKRMREEFGWLSFDLCDSTSWDEAHFASMVFEKLDFHVDKDISFIENYEENARKQFEETAEKLHLTAEERRVFELVRDLGYYKWAREHEFTKAWFLMKSVQDELGRRCGLNSIESKQLLPEEFEEALEKPEEFKQLVTARLQHWLLLGYRGGSFELYSGEEAKNAYLQLEFAEHKVETKATELKGMPACAGKAKGVVRIINRVSHLPKMRAGDILVSIATTPELVSAMKKASAIVTNEGGITCHAAIVSRELGIPCVVGTKVATSVLHDGDTVEVDATRGVIKKVG